MNKPNEAIVPTHPWRFSPSVAIGTLCLIAYIAVFYGIAQASGIDYGEWFANANNAIHSALIPLVAGSLLLIAFLVCLVGTPYGETRFVCPPTGFTPP